MSSTIQRSFAGGIVGPELAGRAEQAKYQTGLKDAVNVIVQRYGGVTNRPGTQFVAEARDGATHPIRLFKFVYNADQTYVLEFGHLYMRVYRDGAAVVPTDDDYLFPGGAYYTGQVYPYGALILYSGVHYYCGIAHGGGMGGDRPPSNPSYVGYGNYWVPMTAGYYEIPSPYISSSLRTIQYVQSGDVVTMVHPDYAPRDLRRTGHCSWTLLEKSLSPAVDRPTDCSATAGGAGANSYRYQVTAFNRDTLEESYPGRDTATSVTGASNANPCQITVVGHPYSTGDEVYLSGVGGMTELNDQTFIITKTGANTFTLDGVDSTAYTAYISGGSAVRPYVRINSAAAPSTSAPHVITANNPGEGYGLWFYRYNNGVYEWIGEANGNASATTVSFNDTNIAGDASLTPPVERTLFAAADDYPSVVTYVQQRLALANTTNQPERIWLSQTGNFSNFSKSSPIQADDTIEFKLAGRQVNAVRHLIEIGGRLIVLTDQAEWTVQGGSSKAITPTDIVPQQHGYTGSASVPPVLIGATALYVQARGGVVRDLRYDFESDGYQGRDLTIFCPDLFDGHSIVAFDYQQTPHSVGWLVRDDGALLGLTYVRDHEVWGWHRHTTDGGDTFEDVVCVPEGSEDAVYVVVNRTIDGAATRYVERFASRSFTDIAVDAFFVDSGLTYDGRNTTATTMTLTGGTLWDETETLTCTASAATFAASNVGDAVVVTAADGVGYTCIITAYTSTTVVSVTPDTELPADIRGAATTSWGLAVDTLTGLDHLEGRTVTALSDGDVNPDMVVTGGEVTLAEPGLVVHVGLPYTARIETLDAENLQGETWMDKKRKVHAVSVRVKDTRGIWLGFGDNTMREHVTEAAGTYGEPTQPETGLITENVDTTWEKTGKVIVEQRDPLPMTILAIIPQGTIGGV